MSASTGLPGLDHILKGLRPGDNVVWRVDNIEDYAAFAQPFCERALAEGKTVVYFRFATHPPVLPEDPRIIVHEVRHSGGFESFITFIHEKIRETGRGGYFVFDSMSELPHICYSDRMIGNFFKLTCPYLFELDTYAYFGIYRHFHSYHAAAPITETTQLLLDVYRHSERLFVQPLKVEGRYSSTMYMLHAWEQDLFRPTHDSTEISDVVTGSPWPGLQSASYRMLGVWDRLFMHAEELVQRAKRGELPREEEQALFRELSWLVISREDRVLELSEKYLKLSDLISIWKHMIGTGMIGGKSVGMILAQAILKYHDPRWRDLLEHSDSFFIGSDVFYNFLVDNQCWWERQAQKHPEGFLDNAEETRKRILQGRFQDYIVHRFSDMLDYYGQNPIIVRSSSLLEDNFGNAFAGKYESIFCPNQGTREERLENFMEAVRTVYASTMSEEALCYRKKRGVLQQDEQMALLVQRVSGSQQGDLFFPQLAGVGFSFNPYVWNKQIDPEAGMIRLVFGLGTRAVDRSDDDYTRVVALNAPELRPEADFHQVKRYAQRKVDVLDLKNNVFIQQDFVDVAKQCTTVPLDLLTTQDRDLDEYYRQRGISGGFNLVLTFDNLLHETPFMERIQDAMRILREAYGSHVDIEFTANFFQDRALRVNILQCRPLQVQVSGNIAPPPSHLAGSDLLFQSRGAVIGQSRMAKVDRVVYVVPEVYGELSEPHRYAVARVIGQICQASKDEAPNLALIGPGRWGTSTPSLGIPVKFNEISSASILCEIDFMHKGLIPDLSLGTHFFNEMVEMNMLYIAFFRGRPGYHLDLDYIERSPNALLSAVPEAEAWSHAIRVVDGVDPATGRELYVYANSLEQRAMFYWQ
jgi:pyruvate,water dikinase